MDQKSKEFHSKMIKLFLTTGAETEVDRWCDKFVPIIHSASAAIKLATACNGASCPGSDR